MAIALTVFGVLPLLRAHPVRWWLVIAGFVFGVTAILADRLLAPLNRAWMAFAHALQKVTTPIFLLVIFILVFTPIALLLRLLGKRPLPLRPDPGLATYWLMREPLKVDREYLERQF
jgi:hypothetical protein